MLLKTQVWLMIFDWSDKIAAYFDLTACFHNLSLEQWDWVAIMAMTYQLWSAVWGNCAPHLLHMWIVFRMSTKYLTWNAATPKKIEKSFKPIYLSVILVSYLPGWRLQLSKSRKLHCDIRSTKVLQFRYTSQLLNVGKLLSWGHRIYNI